MDINDFGQHSFVTHTKGLKERIENMIVNGQDICDRQDCDKPVEPRPCRLDRFCPPHQKEWDNNYDNYVDPQHMYRNKDRIKTHD